MMFTQQRSIRTGTPDDGPASQAKTAAGSQEPAAEAVSPWFLFARKYGIVIFWLLICIGFSIASPAFLTKTNLLSIVEHSAIKAIFAAGQGVVIIAAAIDLSIAPVAAVAGVIAAKLLKADMPWGIALVGGLGVGAAAGWFNGFVALRMKISPLIATLGTFSIMTGMGLILTGSYPIFDAHGLDWLALSHPLGIATSIWIMLALFAVLTVLMGRTVWGVRVQAVGGSPEAARRAGVRVDRYLHSAYIVCGMCAALAGLVTFATLSTAEPTIGDSLIFDAITAVALAGFLLTGGRGSLPKVLIGALILGTIQNGLTILGVPSYYQLVSTGTLLILAVWVEGALERAIERRRTMAPIPSDPTPA
jgi:ribose transport system permease protein